MAIFVVFLVREPARMEREVLRAFPNDHLRLSNNEWLIAAPGTAREVSEKLQLAPGVEAGAAIVFSMANYYGRAPTEVWEWIRTKAEATSG